VSGSHSYTAAGVYTVSVTVTDGSGQSGSATASTFVVVYKPAGGFVTGGGWINSPSGAYTPNASLTGKATFGFVSKYQQGATTPSGNTEFRFQTASFDFKSDSYKWLVISGRQGQYKGTGTINGNSGYSFLLTACDVQVNGTCASDSTDSFRIKIWNTSTGTVIYDNAPGSDDLTSSTQAIGGGDIVIHKS
jgi:PKD repeat protein